MSDDNIWNESRTRSPSVVPDEGIRGFLEAKTANLFATQLQSRLTTLEQTKNIPVLNGIFKISDYGHKESQQASERAEQDAQNGASGHMGEMHRVSPVMQNGQRQVY